MTTTFSERAVARVSHLLAGRSLSRRRFLTKAAVVGSAMAVNPVGYILRPQAAYAQVTDCGSASNCGDGWTAFCATLSKGSNTCPPGSYVAGWWKVDSSSFCPDAGGRPGTRYYIDCNRLPSASCSATCSKDPCDSRAVCRNNFRYGQCNQQIRGVTQVVCRVVSCAPPWEYDSTCTTTVRTDNNTASHTSPYLAPRNASRIRLRWQDMGQTGSVLGRETMAERAGAGGGRIAGYEGGFLVYSAATGLRAVRGAIAGRYEALGLTESVLGYPVTEDRPVGDGVGRFSGFNGGAIYWTPDTHAHEVTRGLYARYTAEGGPRGFLGYPVSNEYPVPADRVRGDFSEGWSIVWDPASDETRIIPADISLPEDGSWPSQVEIVRVAGTSRESTAAALSNAVASAGVPVAFVARSDDFADALSGGVAAGNARGPLLLTRTDELPDATRGELSRLGPATIVVLGGTTAVSARVVGDLEAYTQGNVTRVQGRDRYATAAELSRLRYPNGANICYVATGATFADAVAAGPAAALANAPLLLVRPTELPEVTAQEIRRLGVTDMVVLGGEAAIGPGVFARLRDFATGAVDRVAGKDRYATAAEVAARVVEATQGAVQGNQDGIVEEVLIVTGQDFPDGLAAGPVATVRGAPILLTKTDAVPRATDEMLRTLRPAKITIIGGERAISPEVAAQLSYYVAQAASVPA